LDRAPGDPREAGWADRKLREVPYCGETREGMMNQNQKLSFMEKAGYGAADAAANFVFMTMILFQATFYTEVFGISAGAAATILIVSRLWDAVVDPIVGAFADRTNTRWGKYRPWIIATAIPWCVAMILAYSTPSGWTMGAKIAYAAITNVVLMSIYSMNNMPYAALGAVMTGDVHERAALNSFRFVFVNLAQLIVGGLTLPLVAKFSIGHDRQFGWQVTTTIWAAVCLILFVVTFTTTRERIHSPVTERRNIKHDVRALAKNGPWVVMFLVTLLHFSILSFRGSAAYGYYHHYADSHAMYEWLRGIGLTAPETGAGAPVGREFLATLGLIVRESNNAAMNSNVADVFNSIVNMWSLAVTVLVTVASPALCRLFGKKVVAVGGFALTGVSTFAFYLLSPTSVDAMLVLTAVTAVCYAPTIPLIWAIYADVADYCEWTTGRRCTGVIFATILFALKCGLALGSAGFLWSMAAFFGYGPNAVATPLAVEGYRICTGVVVAVGFGVCAVLLGGYKLNKALTLQMAGELPGRRNQLAATG
jgi:glycoside/pentoside/hexuronide:cation symporter, GPH family